jgi:hypothetical protein
VKTRDTVVAPLDLTLVDADAFQIAAHGVGCSRGASDFLEPQAAEVAPAAVTFVRPGAPPQGLAPIMP